MPRGPAHGRGLPGASLAGQVDAWPTLTIRGWPGLFALARLLGDDLPLHLSHVQGLNLSD